MPETRRFFHKAFLLSVLLKGINATMEIAGGAVLLLVPPHRLSNWITLLTRHLLAQDPDDFLLNKLAALANNFTAHTQYFGAVYLLSHGVMKLAIIACMLRKKLWAYPAMVIMLVLFIVYQLWRYAYTTSPMLLLLTAFDIVFVFLTLLEYRRVRKGRLHRD